MDLGFECWGYFLLATSYRTVGRQFNLEESQLSHRQNGNKTPNYKDLIRQWLRYMEQHLCWHLADPVSFSCIPWGSVDSPLENTNSVKHETALSLPRGARRSRWQPCWFRVPLPQSIPRTSGHLSFGPERKVWWLCEQSQRLLSRVADVSIAMHSTYMPLFLSGWLFTNSSTRFGRSAKVCWLVCWCKKTLEGK